MTDSRMDRAAALAARGCGSLWAVAIATVFIVGGRMGGQWERVDAVCTGGSVILLLVLQRSTNASADATHRKLDEIVRGEPGASDHVIGMEP